MTVTFKRSAEMDVWEKKMDYIMRNPEACTVSEFLMDSAIVFEDKNNFPRRKVCEGFIMGALDLAFRRKDDLYFQDMKDTVDFINWVIAECQDRLEMIGDPDNLKYYMEEHGVDKKTALDARESGFVPPPEKVEH
ncbi:hypothetical protein [Lewinella sp. JB7]|uniref:hypothetical protein n=1 Tax=Lewinella sp. JB7 TaxID=2962887 RepID=UPI0020C9951B|nr:hypothetical protein [Lewinella sp. JB7]MCP9237909.1 hypothetical protein [Lewinella sp. JB7]